MARKFWNRLAAGSVVCAVLSASAFAQYNGGMGGTTGKGGYSSSTGIAVGAGAAAGAGLLYLALHKSSVVGCVQPSNDGMKLLNEKDKKTYALVGGDADLKPGERVALKGKRAKGDSGTMAFHVQKVAKDYGPCNAQAALNSSSPSRQ